MSTRLEQFIKDNREAFDDDVPSPKLWNNIQDKIIPEKKMGTAVVKMNFMRWSAAAAAVVLVALGIWFMMRANPNDANPTGGVDVATAKPATQGKKQVDTTEKNVVPRNDDTANQQLTATEDTKKADSQKVEPYDPGADVKEEMVHYAKLVEIKHRELKNMTKDEPLLYKQFASDVDKLDSVYHSLENKLSKKQNSEELLEAMIQNLQLQMQLLNKQLGIIKQLNHSKKAAYDKAYQSI
jgi:molecular chaperone DnaK (HSP70)